MSLAEGILYVPATKEQMNTLSIGIQAICITHLIALQVLLPYYDLCVQLTLWRQSEQCQHGTAEGGACASATDSMLQTGDEGQVTWSPCVQDSGLDPLVLLVTPHQLLQTRPPHALHITTYRHEWKHTLENRHIKAGPVLLLVTNTVQTDNACICTGSGNLR